MPGLATITIVGLIVAAALTVWYLKLRQRDSIAAFMDKRRGASKLVSRADYVEGVEKIPVAIALGSEAFYYENHDLEASFDLDRLDEIEYADDLSTGRTLPHGGRVLRLRSHGATFEFVMDRSEAAKWENALPARSYGNQATAQAV